MYRESCHIFLLSVDKKYERDKGENKAMNSVLTMAVNDSPITSVKTTQPLIALYCGSRAGNNPIYREKTIELASGIAEQGFGFGLRRCQY